MRKFRKRVSAKHLNKITEHIVAAEAAQKKKAEEAEITSKDDKNPKLSIGGNSSQNAKDSLSIDFTNYRGGIQWFSRLIGKVYVLGMISLITAYSSKCQMM